MDFIIFTCALFIFKLVNVSGIVPSVNGTPVTDLAIIKELTRPKGSQLEELTAIELTTIITVTTKTTTSRRRCCTSGSPQQRKRNLIKMSMGLEGIPEGYPEAHVLNAAYNNIRQLPPFVLFNNSYTGLKKVYLQQNRIVNVSVNAFKGIRQVKYIDLSDNLIRKIDPYTFKGNNRLQKLLLVNNLIYFDRLQTFILSHSMEHLMLSNNKIDQIHEMNFLGLPNLKSLTLNNNPVSGIAPNSFKTLNKLHYLSLANTGVYRLEDTMFSHIPRTLNLEGTPFGAKFEPPLTRVTDESVTKLLSLSKFLVDDYFFNPK